MTRQGRSFSGKERNCCFINTRGSGRKDSRFANISAVSGMDFPDDGRALAAVDWDHDGDLDLWISNRNAPRLRLLRNDSDHENRSIQLRLLGNGKDTNRNGVGARIVVELSETDAKGDPVRLIKTHRAGEGFLSQSSAWLHFGLGKNAEIKEITVLWPNADSTLESFGSVAANGRYELKQGSQKATPVEPREQKVDLKSSILESDDGEFPRRIPIVHQLPAPDLGYFDFQGNPHNVTLRPGRATLVNLWSTTCRPCLIELKEFSERAKELDDAGIDVVALSVDELESGDSQSRQNAESMAKRLKLPFVVGMAPPGIAAELRRLHNLLIKMERPLPLPTSFLFDQNGRLDIIYKGPVEVDTLLEDAVYRDRSLMERFSRAAAFPGTTLDDSIVNSTISGDSAWVHSKMANALGAVGQTERAINEFLLALKSAPESANVHNNLGTLYQVQGNTQTALRYLREAIRINPQHADARINLAQVLMLNRQYKESRQQLEYAVKHHPGNADGHFYMGMVHEREGNLENAQLCYEDAIEANPRHSRSLFLLGKIHERKQDWDKAEAMLERALKLAPNESAILSSLGSVYLQKDKVTQAEKLIQKAIKAEPRNADAYYQLGLVYQRQGNDDAARKQFEAALSIMPQHPGARAALGRSRGGNDFSFPPAGR